MPSADSSAQDQPGQRRYAGRSAAERRDERRGRLLAAGLETFGTVGYAASSIEQLCTDAKVATRSFYEEFPSKEALLIALHDDVNARAFGAVIDTLDPLDPTDIENRLRSGIRAYLEVMTGDPRWARIAFVEMVGATPATHVARRAALARFADLIAGEADQLAEAGLLEKRDYSTTAIGLVGAVTALVETWTSDDDHETQVDRIAETASHLLWLVFDDARI